MQWMAAKESSMARSLPGWHRSFLQFSPDFKASLGCVPRLGEWNAMNNRGSDSFLNCHSRPSTLDGGISLYYLMVSELHIPALSTEHGANATSALKSALKKRPRRIDRGILPTAAKGLNELDPGEQALLRRIARQAVYIQVLTWQQASRVFRSGSPKRAALARIWAGGRPTPRFCCNI